MLLGLIKEIGQQLTAARESVKTREFWIYAAVISTLLLLAVGSMYLAVGFDPLTRAQMKMALSCRTGEGKIATIIIGCFVFGIASVFTLGEVIHWVEERRLSRAHGRHRIKLNHWRPIIAVLGTFVLGAAGAAMLMSWCS